MDASANPVTATASGSDSEVLDKILTLILDSVMRNPRSGPEAVALVAYVTHAYLVPLTQRLRKWAMMELAKEEKVLAEKAWEEVQAIESCIGGWCVPSTRPKLAS